MKDAICIGYYEKKKIGLSSMQIELLNGRLSHHLNCEIAERSYGNSLMGVFSLKIDRKPADDMG
jgi:hypothetical protein